MRIQLSGLPLGPQTFEHSCSAGEYLELTESFSGDINISAEIASEGNSLRLNLHAELPGNFNCDRCGDSFKLQHRCEGEFFFAFDEGGGSGAEREFAIIPKGAVSLDISQEIRDMVMLSIPTKILCSDSCRGLCLQCGINLNDQQCVCEPETGDPRWEALQKLKK
jgi:uncharacterized protein